MGALTPLSHGRAVTAPLKGSLDKDTYIKRVRARVSGIGSFRPNISDGREERWQKP